jgi:hypothetical protein
LALRTNDLIATHWCEVGIVAQALLGCGAMNGEEIDGGPACITRSTPPGSA